MSDKKVPVDFSKDCGFTKCEGGVIEVHPPEHSHNPRGRDDSINWALVERERKAKSKLD